MASQERSIGPRVLCGREHPVGSMGHDHMQQSDVHEDGAHDDGAQERGALRRTDRVRTLASVSRFRVGPVLVHPERLCIERDGEEIALEPRIMELLIALAEHAGSVVGVEQLLIEVWRGTFYGDNPVHRAIGQLRRQLGDTPRAPVFIETIRKRGYRLIAPVAFPQDYRRPLAQVDGWAGRNPYLGLSAYDAGHSEVFFGRSRLTAHMLGAMRRQLDAQRRLLVLVGASGCGKTSLLRAGVLPLLRQAGGFDGLQALAIAHCDFASTADGDPLRPLAAALASWRVEGRPVFAPQPPDALVQRLAETPGYVGEALDEAWQRRIARNESPYAHLLLSIDHAEALVASDRIGPLQRQRVWAVIEAVCSHPRGCTLMVVRGDFHADLIAALPEVAERKGSDGHIDAVPPRAGEIAQIVRMPAFLAGLSFEEDPETGARLDDVLRDAAAGRPDTLPLLQYTLHALYEGRREDGCLTFEAYRRIGGLEGAVAHRAEAVFASLSDEVRAELEHVLEQLILLQPGSESVSARRVPWSALRSAAARTLVDAFVRGRLFVGSQAHGSADFGVAHEALLRQWPRARDWTHDNRRLLQAHARLTRAAIRWEEAGRREDHLLHPGQPLEEALEVGRRLPARLSAGEGALIDVSLRLRRRRTLLRRSAVGALTLLAALSLGLALWATHEKRQAEARRAETLRLSDYMLVDLAEKLRPLGEPSLLADVSRRALELHRREDEAGMASADLVNRSRALRTLGEVLMAKTRLDEARTALVAADNAARAAVRASPDSTEALSEAGIAAYWLGYHYFGQAQYRQAGRHWRHYLDRTGDLLRLEPERVEWLQERSYAFNNLGTLAQAEGRSGEAVVYFRGSAALKRRALAQRPDDADLRYDLIDTLSWIDRARQAQGELRPAAEGYAEQIAMLRSLIEARPAALAWQRRLATSLRRSAGLALDLGRIQQARAMLDESIALLDGLLLEAADNRVWQRDLAHALMDRAELSRIAGDRRTAIAELRRAAALSVALRGEAQGQAEWQRLDALIRARLAALESRAEEESAALDALQRLVEASPDSITGRLWLSTQLVSRGRRLAAAGDTAAADRDLARVRSLLAGVAPGSRDPALLALWAQTHPPGAEGMVDAMAHLEASGYRHPDFVGPAGPATDLLVSGQSVATVKAPP